MTKRMTFTQKTLDAIKPPGKGQTVAYDATVQCLAAWVSPTGRVTFYFYAWSSEHGKPIRRRLGVFRKSAGAEVGMGIPKARELARKEAGRVAEGQDTAAEIAATRQARKVGETLGDVFGAFKDEPSFKTKRPRSASTLRNYDNYYKCYLKKWKDRRLGDITREQIAKLHRDITAGKVAGLEGGPYAANRVLSLLSAVYAFAVRREVVEANPAASIEKNPEQANTRYLTDAEAKAFMGAVRDQYDKARNAKRYGGGEDAHRVAVLDAIVFALFTGQRRGNVESLKWADIDIKARTMRIRAEHFKTKREHIASVPPPAIEILKRRKSANKGSSDFVFWSNRSASGHVTEPKTALADIIKAAKIEHVRFHDLRHTAAAWLVNQGVDLYVVGKQLGHRSLSTTQRYAHLDVTTIHDKVAAGAAAFDAAGKGDDDGEI